jgi:hypothetical protein
LIAGAKHRIADILFGEADRLDPTTKEHVATMTTKRRRTWNGATLTF